MRTHRFDFIITAACFALLGYLAWHAWHGPRGYPYRDRLLEETAVLQDQFAKVLSERTTLEQQVALLRPDHIDPDMLDQLARERLEMVRPNELVVIGSENFQENP